MWVRYDQAQKPLFLWFTLALPIIEMSFKHRRLARPRSQKSLDLVQETLGDRSQHKAAQAIDYIESAAIDEQPF